MRRNRMNRSSKAAPRKAPKAATCAATVCIEPLRPGELVQLEYNDGPVMTVVHTRPDRKQAVCAWTAGKEIRHDQFKFERLTRLSPAEALRIEAEQKAQVAEATKEAVPTQADLDAASSNINRAADYEHAAYRERCRIKRKIDLAKLGEVKGVLRAQIEALNSTDGSRETSLVITKLDEACMWLDAEIGRVDGPQRMLRGIATAGLLRVD